MLVQITKPFMIRRLCTREPDDQRALVTGKCGQGRLFVGPIVGGGWMERLKERTRIGRKGGRGERGVARNAGSYYEDVAGFSCHGLLHATLPLPGN